MLKSQLLAYIPNALNILKCYKLKEICSGVGCSSPWLIVNLIELALCTFSGSSLKLKLYLLLLHHPLYLRLLEVDERWL
jgi:hypothetical protein